MNFFGVFNAVLNIVCVVILIKSMRYLREILLSIQENRFRLSKLSWEVEFIMDQSAGKNKDDY